MARSTSNGIVDGSVYFDDQLGIYYLFAATYRNGFGKLAYRLDQLLVRRTFQTDGHGFLLPTISETGRKSTSSSQVQNGYAVWAS